MALARQGTGTGLPYSLARDNQLRDQIEAALSRVAGKGVWSGGVVSKTAALSVEVAAGSVFLTNGVLVTLDSAQAYTVPNSATVYLWGKVSRTAASQSDPTALDTYSLALTHTLVNSAPSADHSPLAVIPVVSGDIDAEGIDQHPAGKYTWEPSDYLAVDVAGSSDLALTADQAKHSTLEFTGALTGNINVVLPPWPGKQWVCRNSTTGSYTLGVKTSGGTPVLIPQGAVVPSYADGVDVVDATPPADTGITPQTSPASPALTDPTDNETALLNAHNTLIAKLVASSVFV